MVIKEKELDFGAPPKKKVNIETDEIIRVTKIMLGNYADKHNVKLEATERSKYVFRNLALYFCGHPDGAFNLEKGIMLYGCTGSGKTFMMKFFQEKFLAIRRYFVKEYNLDTDNVESNLILKDIEYTKFASVKKIAMEAIRSDLTNLNEYYKYTSQSLFLDDIGHETVVSNYGNKVDVVEEIITRRYELRGRLITHGTSNLKIPQLKEKYGQRFYSRATEIWNFVELADKDYRVENINTF